MKSAAGLDGEPPDSDPKCSPAPIKDRQTFCISNLLSEVILHPGDTGFRDEIAIFYSPAESEAAEKLIKLKATLRSVKGDEFWSTASEGLANLTGAQYAFFCKRLLADDQDANVEMPPVGEPGSCLMATSIYYNDGQGKSHTSKDVKYAAYGSPCAHMKNDKVFLIPEGLSHVIPNNPNELPDQPEAYLAVPLSAKESETSKETVFGHFGVMWNAFGHERRNLSYSFLEMCLHSMEDLVVAGFLERGLFPKTSKPIRPANSVIPHTAVTPSQSLKPFARSLSHELRTPMQGVVGMLDLMYATVQEASEGQNDARLRDIFASLRENIEIVQDSSRRAVEAADNVVHAYDMNMEVPQSALYRPIEDEEEDVSFGPDVTAPQGTGTNVHCTSNDTLSPVRSHKRLRSSVDESGGRHKIARRTSSDHIHGPQSRRSSKDDDISNVSVASHATGVGQVPSENQIVPGVRHTNIRDLIQFLVNDVLKVGGRPESAIAQQIDGGEQIEVRQRSSNGEEMEKLVQWVVDSEVPDTIFVDERDLASMFSRVFHNAFKFTETGRITISVRPSPRGRYILVSVADTGTGIPTAFMPNLFKAFSKEDDGINRQSEGLGLGLMVAKGLARKLNGDLYAVRSETSGPNRGTEFEMRIPMTPGESISRPCTPYGSRSPSVRSSVDMDMVHGKGSVPIAHSSKSGSPTSLHEGAMSSHRRNPSNSAVNVRSRSSTLRSGAHHKRRSDSISLPDANTSQPRPPAESDALPQLTPARMASTSYSNCAPPLPNIPSIFSLSPFLKNNQLSMRATSPRRKFDIQLAKKLPLSFLVVEDNLINRKLAINMLKTLGYHHIHDAHDGADAVRKMEAHRKQYLAHEVDYEIDCVLMDLWMPTMNGYQAAERILKLADGAVGARLSGGPVGITQGGWKPPVIVAVTADVTDEAIENVARVGMKGPLTKPYKLLDLERSIIEFCAVERMNGVNNLMVP